MQNFKKLSNRINQWPIFEKRLQNPDNFLTTDCIPLLIYY